MFWAILFDVSPLGMPRSNLYMLFQVIANFFHFAKNKNRERKNLRASVKLLVDHPEMPSR